jgi:F-type H+-transporting ATPase subunit delta
MKSTMLGRRYAGALLDLGAKDGQAEAYGDQLAAVAEILGAGEAKKALTSPLYGEPFKRALIDQTARQAALLAPVANLLRVLLDAGRIGLLAEIATAYRELLDEHLGISRATVVSAVPLDSAAQARLRVLLQKKAGRRVELAARTDPSVLGGLRVHVGSKVYDATIANHLARLRESLKRQV